MHNSGKLCFSTILKLLTPFSLFMCLYNALVETVVETGLDNRCAVSMFLTFLTSGGSCLWHLSCSHLSLPMKWFEIILIQHRWWYVNNQQLLLYINNQSCNTPCESSPYAHFISIILSSWCPVRVLYIATSAKIIISSCQVLDPASSSPKPTASNYRRKSIELEEFKSRQPLNCM